jgi:transcriptional regulator with PAS, ATPase and Fis domain
MPNSADWDRWFSEFAAIWPIVLRSELFYACRCNATVLITGEGGVGKEFAARTVHEWSERAKQPFVAVNCASGSEAFLEAELFGLKGIFNGAYRDEPGKLQLGHEGTICFDEFAALSLRMQGLLYRFLKTREVHSIGGGVTKRINARIISTSSRNLTHMVAEHSLREDLYYRLNVIHILVPPLRERREDIPLLLQHFITRVAGATNRGVSPRALAALAEYEWPGNVRELQNVVGRLVTSVPILLRPIEVEDLPHEIRSGWHSS